MYQNHHTHTHNNLQHTTSLRRLAAVTNIPPTWRRYYCCKQYDVTVTPCIDQGSVFSPAAGQRRVAGVEKCAALQ